MTKVRVRFAPSPTGALHIGGVRTALFNYLFARQHGGDMLLRIEDTDSTRFVPGAEEYITESLAWLGIEIDEGICQDAPNGKGDHGPYRQSERRDIYHKYVDQLLASGNAYIAFDTPEQLEAKRAEIANFQYDARTREQMVNSLTLSKEEVEARIAAGEKYVVRFKVEPNIDVHVHDLIRGEVVINSNILDDKVLYKSADDLPTYHLANIVDDHLMEISHVIRGEEWLPSAPLHVLLYKAFGWEDTMPQFAHLPLLLKPDGNGKLSKRDGDRLGFPVFPLEFHNQKDGSVSSGYREEGYYPEAVINFLALLGWHATGDQEMYTMQELIEQFSLERVSKSGAKFDYEKGKWFNHQYLQLRSNEELAEQFMPILKARLSEYSVPFASSPLASSPLASSPSKEVGFSLGINGIITNTVTANPISAGTMPAAMTDDRGASKFSAAMMVFGLGDRILPHLPPPIMASSSFIFDSCSLLPMMIAIGAIVMTATSMNTPMPVRIMADNANAR